MSSYSCFLLSFLLAGACSTGPDPESNVAEIPSPAALPDTVNVEVVPTRETLTAFLVELAGQTLVSMALAEIAMDRAFYPEVRELAERIRVEHREMYNAVVRIGAELRVRIPDQMSEEAYENVVRLAAYDGRDLDRAYLDAVVAYHEWVSPEIDAYQTFEELPAMIQLARQLSELSMRHLDDARRVSRTLLLERAGELNN